MKADARFVAFLAITTLLLTGCGKTVTGVYELDITGRLNDIPQQTNSLHKYTATTERARKANYISFEADRAEMILGTLFRVRGTFRVDGSTIYVNADAASQADTNAAKAEASGKIGDPDWHPTKLKPVYELYMPNDRTIMFEGATFRKRF